MRDAVARRLREDFGLEYDPEGEIVISGGAGESLLNALLVLIEPGYHQPQMFDRGPLADWDHSAWERREVIHAGPDKVHIDTRFTRYRKDGTVIGGFDSVYVVTLQDGHWGVKIRSSFAP